MVKMLVSILFGLVGFVLQRLIVWLNRRVHESAYAQKLQNAKEIVQNVVEKLYQTVVEKEKAAGSFSIKRQQQILSLAIEESKTAMRKSVKRFLQKEFCNINQWIGRQVEATIYMLKHENMHAA